MKRLLGLIAFSLVMLYLPAQSWQELYDKTETCWGSDWAACQKILNQALEVAASEFGESDANYMRTLNDLALVQYYSGKYDSALVLLNHCIELEEQFLPSGHLLQLESKGNLANFLMELGKHQEAERLLEDVLVRIEKSLGKSAVEYGITLGNLADLNLRMGRYQQAIVLAEETSIYIEKTLGRGSVPYISALNVVSNSYNKLGDLDKALEIAEQTISLTKSNYPPEHQLSTLGLNNLATLYSELGQYEKSLAIRMELSEIIETTLGRNHPEYATHLGNLAVLYKLLGDIDKAIELDTMTLNILQNTLGKDHYRCGIRLNNLGDLYSKLGKMDLAIASLEEAVRITKSALGEEHFLYTRQLSNLGQTYMEAGKYDKALEIIQQALDLTEQYQGANLTDLSTKLSSLGTLYGKMGRMDEALSIFKRSLSIAKVHIGTEHMRYGGHLSNLALGYIAADLPDSAAVPFLAMIDNYHLQIQRRFPTLNARLQQLLLTKLEQRLVLANSYMLAHPENRDFHIQGFEQQLWHKGLLMGHTQRLLSSIRQSPDRQLRETYATWESLNKQLGRQYELPLNKRASSFDSLENMAGKLEIQLANQSLVFREARKQIRYQDIQATLKTGEVVIEFSHIPLSTNQTSSDSIIYVAYVLQAGTEPPLMIPMFEERELRRLIEGKQVDAQQISSQLYTSRGIRPKKQLNSTAKGLKELLYTPLERQIQQANRIYYVPSGWINRLSLPAIQIEGDILWGDRHELVQLGSSKSLLFSQDSTAFSRKDALLFGGITYDREEENPSSPKQDSFPHTSNLDNVTISSRGKAETWSYLPGTLDEVNLLFRQLTKEGYTVSLSIHMGAQEANLKRLGQSPSILHIATHGYFFPDPSASHNSSAQHHLQLSDHPMVRSGLILAGANHAWAGNPVPEGQEDGILTAYEISRMDLSNTELVVLSACETGLGEIQGNEGVYGLQRAFKIAGAKYVMMSLWQVPDKATQELMTAFYENWLGGMEIRVALQAAQKQMRKKYKEPYYWAGFVLVE